MIRGSQTLSFVELWSDPELLSETFDYISIVSVVEALLPAPGLIRVQQATHMLHIDINSPEEF